MDTHQTLMLLEEWRNLLDPCPQDFKDLFRKVIPNESGQRALWHIMCDDQDEIALDLLSEVWDIIFYLKPKWYGRILNVVLRLLIVKERDVLTIPLIGTTIDLPVNHPEYIKDMDGRQLLLCIEVINQIRDNDQLSVEGNIMFDETLAELKAICESLQE